MLFHELQISFVLCTSVEADLFLPIIVWSKKFVFTPQKIRSQRAHQPCLQTAATGIGSRSDGRGPWVMAAGKKDPELNLIHYLFAVYGLFAAHRKFSSYPLISAL